MLRAAHAGHPPGLVVRATGDVEPLGGAGPLLGVMRDQPFGQDTVTLRPGDAVVLFTDGVTDAKGHTDLFGWDRAVDTAGALAGSGAQAIADGIVAAVQDHAVDELSDDVAVLVAVVKPPR